MLPTPQVPHSLWSRRPVSTAEPFLPKVVTGVLVGFCLLSACIEARSSAPVGLDRAVLTPVPAARAWIVQEDGITVGSVVRYAERGQDGRFLYMVRNLWDQDLGVIDELGRAWRRVPHEEDRWIGTGTVSQGVQSILGIGQFCTMTELPIDQVEAATAAARAG